MLTWHYVTRAQYDAADASAKTADKLFFLSDTKEIYRGTQLFTESVILYTTEPTVKAVGKLYVNATTLEGKIWDGSAWTTVIHPVQAAIDAADAAKPVSGKAVADYVADQISAVTGSEGLVANVEYVAADNGLKVTMADGTSDTIPMSNVAADLVYDATTGLLQVKNAAGTAIGTGINLDLERFVSEASYDHETGMITLKFNDDQEPLTIDIGDLVDTYTAKNSSTVALTVTGNEFVAEAIVSSAAGNQLQKTDNGLFVAATDLSDYSTTAQMETYVGNQIQALKDGDLATMNQSITDLGNNKANKVTSATAGNLASLTAEGDLADAGVAVGGATLAASASASVLATEAAVAAIRTALQTAIDGKMDMVGEGHTGEIIVADANGNASASGYKAGDATMSTKDATTLASEAGVVSYVEGYTVAKTNVVETVDAANASAAKVTSEAAVVDALTWKTSI